MSEDLKSKSFYSIMMSAEDDWHTDNSTEVGILTLLKWIAEKYWYY